MGFFWTDAQAVPSQAWDAPPTGVHAEAARAHERGGGEVAYLAHTLKTVRVWNLDHTGLRALPSARRGPLKVRLARSFAERMAGEVVAAMDDGRLAKLNIRLAQLKASPMRWVERSLAELSGMGGPTPEDVYPRRLTWRTCQSAEQKHKRGELLVE